MTPDEFKNGAYPQRGAEPVRVQRPETPTVAETLEMIEVLCSQPGVQRNHPAMTHDIRTGLPALRAAVKAAQPSPAHPLAAFREHIREFDAAVGRAKATLERIDTGTTTAQPSPRVVEALRKAWMAGWSRSGEGFNAEHGASDERVAKMMEEDISAISSTPQPAPPAAAVGWQPTHQHRKGGLYRVIATGRIEADLTPCVVYDDADGRVWVRPAGEFNDGRFAPLPAPPSGAGESA